MVFFFYCGHFPYHFSSHCFWSSRNSFKRMCYFGDDDVSTHLCIWYRHQHEFFFKFRETGLESAQSCASEVIIVCLRSLERLRRRRCRECDTGFQLNSWTLEKADSDAVRRVSAEVYLFLPFAQPINNTVVTKHTTGTPLNQGLILI